MSQDEASEDNEGKIVIDCQCKKLALCLDENQYGQVINLVEFFRNYSNSISVRRGPARWDTLFSHKRSTLGSVP